MGLATKNYSDFLTSWCALVGIPTSGLTTEIAAVANTCFNTAMKKVWESGPWLENTPRGEARFAGNKINYPNNLAQTSAWTATALTITANAIEDPLDGRTTASKLLETAANSAHSVAHTANAQTVSTQYTLSAQVRFNGRSYVYLKYADGDLNHTCFFNVTTGVVGTATNCVGTISQFSNGYYLCQITFTTSTSITPTGIASLQVSTDGSTLSYAGDITKGLYVWGVLVQQISNNGLQDFLIPWEQDGEEAIECVFDVYQTSPFATQFETRQGYDLTPYGIQLVAGTWTSFYVNGVNQSNIYGNNPANPVYLFYRRLVPDFSGDEFDATATYAVTEQVYFIDSLGKGNFYRCLVATTAGQDPEDTPNSWSLLTVYATFFQFCVYQAYGDWLISDGQMDKATGAYAIAEGKMTDSFDRMERQMGDVMPVKVQSHFVNQARGGY